MVHQATLDRRKLVPRELSFPWSLLTFPSQFCSDSSAPPSSRGGMTGMLHLSLIGRPAPRVSLSWLQRDVVCPHSRVLVSKLLYFPCGLTILCSSGRERDGLFGHTRHLLYTFGGMIVECMSGCISQADHYRRHPGLNIRREAAFSPD